MLIFLCTLILLVFHDQLERVECSDWIVCLTMLQHDRPTLVADVTDLLESLNDDVSGTELVWWSCALHQQRDKVAAERVTHLDTHDTGTLHVQHTISSMWEVWIVLELPRNSQFVRVARNMQPTRAYSNVTVSYSLASDLLCLMCN